MHTIHVSQTTSKEERYKELYPQIKTLLEGESDKTSNMANLAAALKEVFNFLWVGFYIVKEEYLVLGPFQGTVACTRIKYGKGVCGKAWETGEIQIVPNVDLFPGHIACSSFSRSEIVLPVKRNGEVVAVLDIDSDCLNNFDEIDRYYLGEIVILLDY